MEDVDKRRRFFPGYKRRIFAKTLNYYSIIGRVHCSETTEETTGVVKTRNAGISRNMAEYHGIWRNITEYGGITRNITTFSRNIPEHHNIFRW